MQVHVPKPLHGWRGGSSLRSAASRSRHQRAQAVPAAIDQDPPIVVAHRASDRRWR